MNDRPFVSFTAYDTEGNELTSTIEIECMSDAEAIEVWQRLRELVTKYVTGKDC